MEPRVSKIKGGDVNLHNDGIEISYTIEVEEKIKLIKLT